MVLRFGVFALDLARRHLCRETTIIHLTPKAIANKCGASAFAQSAAAKWASWSARALTNAGRAVARAT